MENKNDKYVRPGRHMVSEHNQLLVGFTPKAACSVASKLFFQNIGELEEALALNNWIHKYRVQYTKKNPLNFNHLTSKEYLKVKFVRNPFTRVISSYLHAMRNGVFKEELKEFFSVEDERDISFQNFLEFLSTLNLNQVDPHVGFQKLPGEGKVFKYDQYIKIEELEVGLQQLESKYGSAFELDERIVKSSHHMHQHNSEHFVGDKSFNTLTHYTPRTKDIPDYSQFYNKQIISLVKKLFKVDIKFYKYKFDLY